MSRRIYLLLLMAVLAITAACSVNPVTGKSEIVFVSESSEIKMGAKNYLPMQQSQGGEYDIDPALTEYVSGVGDRLARDMIPVPTNASTIRLTTELLCRTAVANAPDKMPLTG